MARTKPQAGFQPTMTHYKPGALVPCARALVAAAPAAADSADAGRLPEAYLYDVVDVVQSYYHDGEAAYLMQADVKKLAAADAAEDASEEAVLAA